MHIFDCEIMNTGQMLFDIYCIGSNAVTKLMQQVHRHRAQNKEGLEMNLTKKLSNIFLNFAVILCCTL